MISETDDELVLTLQLEPGKNADAVVAADTLLAWVAAIQEAHGVLDPSGQVIVELIAAEIGSLKLRAALRFVEDRVVGPTADALTEYPRIKKLVVATVVGIPPTVIAAGIVVAAFPDATVKLSPPAQERYLQETRRVQEVPAVQQRVRTFYSSVARDRAVSGIAVSEGVDEVPLIAVPRAEFAQRGGVWEIEAPGEHERPRKDVWRVVVTHPVLRGRPLAWKFERDGLPFQATMADKAFLNALRTGTLGIGIQEGVELTVEVEWTERLDGQTWEPLPRSRKITRVLSPARPTGETRGTPLFP